MQKTSAVLLLAVGLFALDSSACDFSSGGKMLKAAVQTNPGNASAWYALGRTQYLKGCHAEARDSLLRAVLLDPTKPEAWRSLGLADLKLDRFEEGVAALTMWRSEKAAVVAARSQ